MRIFSTLFLLTILSFNSESKIYTYSVSHFSESIELSENNRFQYSAKMHMMGKMEIEGSYYILNDTLYLNSIPQRDKILVEESKSKKRNDRYFYFNVKSKAGSLLIYHLHLRLENGKEIIYRDQFQNTRINSEKFVSFYIVDTKGLKSPTYIIEGLHTNIFNVQFETHRVFENESWILKNDSIIPRGLDGEFQKYSLKS